MSERYYVNLVMVEQMVYGWFAARLVEEKWQRREEKNQSEY